LTLYRGYMSSREILMKQAVDKANATFSEMTRYTRFLELLVWCQLTLLFVAALVTSWLIRQ
jgi:hypothetical protein